MDYKTLGLRVGLEIHQQLASRHKLFCGCPIELKHGLTEKDFPVKIKRKLRPVAGELGVIDQAALYEFYRSRTFLYSMNENTCLVEADEEPPHNMNFGALYTVLQACKMLDCTIVDEIHVMRKTVIDGSAVSGFQRTALIGKNGSIKISSGNIGITTVCIEEDAATTLEKKDEVVNYRLDRLGVPLIEVTTDSSIKSPEQAAETAHAIGSLLRSLDVVRGIGSIRQDVNISIREGSRVEIKGFQELEKMKELISNEVQRQQALIAIKDELKKRGYVSKKHEQHNVTKLFSGTKCNFIKKATDERKNVFAMIIPKFAGLLKRQCGDRTFGKELNAYAQAYGYGIIHSDEDLSKYNLVSEFHEIKKLFGAEDEDLIIISVGKNPEQALQKISERCNECMAGVPEETRVSDDIGSKYTRPLPGGERMYPESDIQTEVLDEEFIDSIELPKTLEEKTKEFEKIMPKELALQLVESRFTGLFERLYEKYPSDPVVIATTLLSTMKDMKRKGFDIDKIKEDDLENIFAALHSNKIAKKSVRQILEKISIGEDVKNAVESMRLISSEDLEKIVYNVVKKNPGLSEKALAGLVMESAKGRADGENVLMVIKKTMQKRN